MTILFNSFINSTKIFEQNEKIINDIYFIVIAKGEIDLLWSYASAILNVAQQCPLEGGPAVYRARSLYALIDLEYEYNDTYSCLQNGWMLRQASTIKSNFTIFPNPANETITLKYNIDVPVKIQVLDPLGRLVLEKQLDEKFNEININVNNLNPGIYNYRIINLDGPVLKNDQFSIIR